MQHAVHEADVIICTMHKRSTLISTPQPIPWRSKAILPDERCLGEKPLEQEVRCSIQVLRLLRHATMDMPISLGTLPSLLLLLLPLNAATAATSAVASISTAAAATAAAAPFLPPLLMLVLDLLNNTCHSTHCYGS